jgi:SAM-dependent methyltransferase
MTYDDDTNRELQLVERSGWDEMIAKDPNHSNWYIERFRTMAAAGDDLNGEARLVDAMSPRAARILDAGCGSGRVGGYLSTVGHTVVGVDGDPVLIAAAEEDHPGPSWLVGDLSELDLESRGIDKGFDMIVCAGNVMTFLAKSTRREVLTRLGRHLSDEGRIVVGFGAGRGYEFDQFRTDVSAAGLLAELELESWDLRPIKDSSEFIVAVLGRRPE